MMLPEIEQIVNTPDVVEFTVTRLRQISSLSNLDVDDVFEWAGVNLDNLNVNAVHREAYWKLMIMKMAERDRLQQFGMQLFESTLTDWVPG